MTTTTIRSAIVTTALVCAALAATDAQAQFGGGMGGGMKRGSAERGTSSTDPAAARQSRPMLTDRLDQLVPQLLLSQEQLRLWDKFRAAFMALQQPAGGVVALSDSATAMRSMQQKLSQAQNRYALVEALVDALKQLDAQLDTQQRATADRLLPPIFAEFVRTGGERDHSL